MSELSLITINDDMDFPVDGRTLHEQLEISTQYSKWLDRMCEYGFESGKDFDTVVKNAYRSDGTIMPQSQTDHNLTLSMAKEICMLQRTEKGRTIRRYLLEVEENWNRPEVIMARALKMANGTINKLTAKAEENAPKVLFADSVSASKTDILVRDMAKILKQNGVDMGEKRLFRRLREDGFLIKRVGNDWNSPTQRSMELGVMRFTETTINRSDGQILVCKTPKITGKGQVYFATRYAGGVGNA